MTRAFGFVYPEHVHEGNHRLIAHHLIRQKSRIEGSCESVRRSRILKRHDARSRMIGGIRSSRQELEQIVELAVTSSGAKASTWSRTLSPTTQYSVNGLAGRGAYECRRETDEQRRLRFAPSPPTSPRNPRGS